MKVRDQAASLYSPFSQLAQPLPDSSVTPPLSAILPRPWVPRAPLAVQANFLLQPSHFPTVDPVRRARNSNLNNPETEQLHSIKSLPQFP